MNELVRKSKKLAIDFVDIIREIANDYDIYDVINNLEDFIEQFDVKVFYSNMEGFDKPHEISGYSLVNDEGKPEIVLNVNDSEQRQRFTMAHEFGHIVMHWNWLLKKEEGTNLKKDKYEVLFRKANYSTFNNDLKEIQANEFAAELLLPHELIINAIGNIEILNNPIDLENMKQRVAVAFKVSSAFAKTQLIKIKRGEFEYE